uniref:Uncharacterized protein n=1 Tax=Rhizophora mucronata TaxID=61149 RepID=A0A2P2MEY7_RHIMU
MRYFKGLINKANLHINFLSS